MDKIDTFGPDLLPEQSVMVESDTADMLFGDPFTLLNAADLEGFRGIERDYPTGEIEVVQLQFDEDEVVFANAGALVFCPSTRAFKVEALLDVQPQAAGYRALPSDEAAMLIDCLVDEDVVAGGWAAEPMVGQTYAAACA